MKKGSVDDAAAYDSDDYKNVDADDDEHGDDEFGRARDDEDGMVLMFIRMVVIMTMSKLRSHPVSPTKTVRSIFSQYLN